MLRFPFSLIWLKARFTLPNLWWKIDQKPSKIPRHALTEEQIAALVNMTQHLTNLLERELQLAGFWESHRLTAQNRLKAEIQKLLLSPENSGLPGMVQKISALVSRIMELAKSNNDIILYA